MKTKTMFMLLGITCLMQSITAQAPSGFTLSTIEPKQSAEEQKAIAFFLKNHPDRKGYEEFISSWRNSAKNSTATSQDKIAQPASPMSSCTNVDFEQGNLSGWTQSTGFNPNYNPSGCCPTAGGAQVITSGAGVDPCGGFPLVCPGGTYSVRLGDNNVNGIADRLEQTFQVSSSNTNYSYKYAVVLEDPGHSLADQPSFQIDMVDANGNPIPCTFYQVSAGQGIPGFLNSSNCPGVIYKPWTTVSVDLSAYLNQLVTIRFTTYDCALGGHYGYAYIDGSCSPLTISQSNILCSNSSTTLCAPAGFSTYVWNGPGVNNVSGQCITASAAGNYNVQMTSITGCSSPLINMPVTMIQAPVANFTINNNNGCNSYISFTNNTNGLFTSYWNFGDGDTSALDSPSHTYAAYGTYTVTLYVSSLSGCTDTATGVVTINPPPAPGMSYAGVCEGTPFQFTGTMSGNTQNTSWLWTFGNGATSTLQNPVYTFPSWGSFPVSLSVTNNGCTTIITQSVSVKPNPVVSIISSPVCLANPTTFTNNTTIPLGTVSTWEWDYTNDGIIDNTAPNAVNTYPASGTYTASLRATSNYGCVHQNTTPPVVYALPTASFTDANNCLNVNSVFVNNSSAPAGSALSQYYWDFGDGAFSLQQTPSHTYASAGNFQVSLSVTTNNGCVASYVLPVNIFALPAISFTASSFCANQNTQFAGNTSGAQAITQWNWNFGGGTASVQNPSYHFPAWGTYTVTLTATDANGCVNNTSQTVNIQPVPLVALSSNAVCLGAPTTFTNSSSIPSGSISAWAWDYNADGVIDNTAQSASTTYPLSGAYNVVLSATSNAGCVSTATVQSIVNALPIASFNTANNCLHMPSFFANNSSAPSGSTISQYSWTYGNGNSSTAQQSPYTYTSAGTYQVTLAVTTSQGCTSSVTNPITIYPAPVANFSSNPVCENQHMQFTDQSGIFSGTITAWKWDFTDNGTIDATLQNPQNVFTSGGNYNTQLTVISNFGCKDSIVRPSTVYFNPVADFSAGNVCLGNSAHFTDASTNQNGYIAVWDWDFTSDGTIDNFSQSTTNTYTTAGLFLVTLQVQNNYGCIGLIKKSVRVNPTPVVNIDVTHKAGCDGQMCVGMINNSTISGGSVKSWQWNFGDNTTSNQNSPTHCFHEGTFTVALVATSDSGCAAMQTMPGSIVVYPKPVADFYFTNTELDVLDATTGITSNAHGASSYIYFISDGTHIVGQANFQHSFPNENPGSYTVIQFVSNSFGCKDTIAKDIEIKPGFTFYIPNAFSPNGDGMNDIFKGTGIGIKQFTLLIYDRWGNLVFTSDDLEKGWDGTLNGGDKVSLQDVFVWKVRLHDGNDTEHDYKGTVSLIK